MAEKTSTKKGSPPINTAAARTLLQQAPLAANQTVILARGPQLMAYRGDLKNTEAMDVAVFVAEQWSDTGQTVRLQFMRLPVLPAERLLYTCRLQDGFLLTITDAADAPLSRVTGLAGQLLRLLERIGLNGYN